MRRVIFTLFGALAILLPTFILGAGTANATGSTGTGIGYTLAGCRASTNAYVAPGQFICPTPNYTTGNLGKGWNEFDLVPGRVTLSAGNSAPATQNFDFVIAVDNCSGNDGSTGCKAAGDFPGYDILSSDSGGTPTLNSTLSSASGCGTISAGPEQYSPPTATGSGGTSLYRVISITGEAANTTCVYDFWARLAFNSHLYPGSSLHYNLLNDSLGTQGIGSKDVSIPVSAILPPGFTKTQVSSQGSGNVWTVSKQSTPASFNFPNTCSTATSEPTSQGVSTTINWHLTTSSAGDITVVATLNLVNNAHRAIDVSVSDQLYNGSTPTPGNEDQSPKVTPSSGFISLAAGATDSFNDTWDVPSGTATSFSDVATASFYDPIQSDQLLGTASAHASSTLQTVAPTSGTTAVVSDVISLTGSTNFDYSVDSTSPSEGNFGTYVLGTKTTGSVTWTSPTLTTSGSVTLNQTVYVVSPNTDSATLSDTATITPNGQAASQASSTSTVTGNAVVSIEIQKTTSIAVNGANTFPITATGTDSSGGTTDITIPAGTTGPVDGTITGLNPGIAYTISEPGVGPFKPQPSLGPVTVNLPSCSASLPVRNVAAPAVAQVQKITDPLGSTMWTYTLTGIEANGTTPVSDLADGTSEPLTITANTGYQQFASNLDVDGATYTITETPVTNWDLTSLSGDLAGDATRVSTSESSRTCSFTLDVATDAGQTFECSYTNTERGALNVQKVVNWNGVTPSGSFTICITGPSYSDTRSPARARCTATWAAT
jgi:hypothetical protein